MKTITVAIVAALALSASAQPTHFDELQPRPKKLQPAPGFCADAANVRFEKKPFSGLSPAIAAEAYELVIAEDGVTVRASDPKGTRHAKTTLAQLIKLSGGRVPCGTVTDWPRYRWRGLMHDCGRNYLDIPTIRRILDMMAAYKFNLFHWHITDYYGWRLESEKYPELQAPWAFRRQMSKYYTRKEFREVLEYAKERGITVMPELDVPGHTLSFRRGLNIEHMAERKVKGIICDLIDELCTLATPEEMPYIHLGTDEARTPWEQVPDSYCPAWAAQVRKNGRTPVGWYPGKPMKGPDGLESVKMIWYDELKPGAGDSVFDTCRLYFGSADCLNMLNIAAFTKPFRYELPESGKLGPVMCSWHDDMLGEDTSVLLRNIPFAPAIVMYSSIMWEDRQADRAEYMAKLPAPGTPDFAYLRDFENRIIAQRDKVFAGIDVPFPFVRQSDMRWRISDDKGNVVARDVAQGTVYVRKWERLAGPNVTNSFIAAKTGVAVLETWIRSGEDREIGAWIGFTHFGRSGGRTRGLPDSGEWETLSKGIRVEVGGKVVPPPAWGRPGFRLFIRHPEEPTSNLISELPFTNEEYWMREPSKISLVKGWNHVRITLPHVEDRYNYNWVATFMPVAGTTSRPREVEGLEYSSDPQK